MILVIDDDPTVAPLVSGLLAAGGEGSLDVTPASTLKEGMQSLREAEHCLVLLDLRLPDSDGLQTLASCRAIRPTATPIIVLTADGDRALAVAALREGADDFLLKTDLTPQTLARTIRYAIERHQHRTALREVELRAKAVVESIDSMIGIVDQQGVLLQVNRAWRDFANRTGCPVMLADEGVQFIGFCRSLNHSFGSFLVDEITSLLAGRERRTEETIRGMPPCGTEVSLRVRACPVELPSGRAVAIIIDDFSDKLRYEQELAASAERLSVAIEASHVGTWDWEVRSGRIRWSAWHYRIVGLTESEFDGTLEGFFRCVHPDDRDLVHRRMEASRIERRPFEATFRIVRPNGAIRWVESLGRYFYDSDGTVVRMSGAIVDRTEQRLEGARHVLSQRIEAIGELSAGVAHDLRNTLNLANSALGTLDLAIAKDSPEQAALDDLRLATSQANQLVSSLVRFAQPYRNDESPIVDLTTSCLDFVAFLRRLLPKSMRLVAHCGGTSASARIAPIHLQQVVMNLVLNARDATRGMGEVRVRVLPGVDEHTLEVEDNGPGIEERDIAHLFEPYFTGKEEGAGAGLGLTIVKTIVDGCGGSIAVRSALGQGTTFSIRLPAAEPAARMVADPAVPRASIEEKPRRLVAMALPGEYGRRVLADGLEEAGFRVIECSDAASLERAVVTSSEPMAAVVIDDELPGVSARALIQRLRTARCRAPVVLMSAANESDDESGDVLPVPKPFSVGQVCAAVQAVLEDDESIGLPSTL